MGILYVVATPIGNLEDITIRAIRTLLTVQVIACEDTRRTGQLVKMLRDKYWDFLNIPHHEVRPRYVSVRDWNEAEEVEKLVFEVRLGEVALVSDGGTPLISDPGYKVVKAVREAGLPVVTIPGPSAVTASLSISGLPTNKFTFWGFWQPKIELNEGTNIIYESPIRAKKTVAGLKSKYHSAEIKIACELTKVHEKVYTEEEFLELEKVLGEVTILVYLPTG